MLCSLKTRTITLYIGALTTVALVLPAIADARPRPRC